MTFGLCFRKIIQQIAICHGQLACGLSVFDRQSRAKKRSELHSFRPHLLVLLFSLESYFLKRRVIVAALWLGFLPADHALAEDAVYVAIGTDATPRFSNQPYDDDYSFYLGSRRPQARRSEKAVAARAPIAERRAAALPHIQQAARQHGMDPALLAAVAEVESGFNANALSPKGAMGTMQLIPKTAADYGVVNPYDMQQNLEGGTRYLKDLLAAHDGNLPLALAAYNAGKGRVLRHNQRIPPFNETMLYVPRVLAKMAEYQRSDDFQRQ